MRIFIAALVLVGLCVLGMSVGILLHRGFPKSDIDDNEELRKRGISCYKPEDARLQKEGRLGERFACDGTVSESCKGCSFFELENKK